MALPLRAGIDIGGTFTDGVLLDGQARLHVAKVATTPDDLTQGFFDVLSALERESGVDAKEVGYLVHGSTVATNAILQGRTARVGLLTTAGFRDVLEIGTQQRANLYDLRDPKKAPLVPRELRVEARERIGPEGQVWEELVLDDVRRAAAAFGEAGVEAVAVCFLFSFANAVHEEEARHLLGAAGLDVPVSISSEVAPEFREYLRTSTTAVNAALLPLVGRYVERLEGRLAQAGVSTPLHLMQSNGGVALPTEAARLPVGLIASGPAAGVIAAARLGKLAGSGDVLGFDMGGTTADVSLIVGGAPQMRFRGEAAGHPVNLPQIDVLSVGAGGGSIARVDRFGSLAAGPESAGADPGPAAYGRGGEEATVTDAHVVLGTLDPDRFLGGRMALDSGAARRAVERTVGGPLSFGLEEAAAAVVRIANATMVRALRVISVARGHDPRRFALVAFGGAGPMHACPIARELGIGRVIVPRYPGVASALGLIVSDVRHDLRQTWVRLTRDLSLSELRARFAELELEGQELLAGAGFADGDARITFELDMRYRGQAYELTVPFAAHRIDEAALRGVEGAFHDLHRQAYGHDSPVEEIEIVTLRAHAIGPVPAPQWDGAGVKSGTGAHAAEQRTIWTPGRGRERYAVYEREALGEGAALDGPAIVEQDDSTVVVEPGWRLTVGAAETVVLDRQGTE
jgi:N-methylhydantoinase A